VAEGLAELDRAMELDPLNVDGLRTRAEILELAGDREGARSSFDQAIEIRPHDWITIESAGAFYYDQLDFETAISYFQRVTEIRPEMAHGWSNLGGALMWSGRLEGARTAMDRSVAIGPTYEGLSNLGTLEFYEGRFSDAVVLFEQALAIDDTDWRVWNNRAESLRFGGGDADRASEAFEETARLAEVELESKPGDADLGLTAASAHAASGEHDRARQRTDEVITRGVEDPELMQVIASIEVELGNTEQALIWLERALAAGYPMAGIEGYPLFDALREDPGFEPLRTTYGADAAVDSSASRD
jgi:tetratricopeptide (TPR) repeat protein